MAKKKYIETPEKLLHLFEQYCTYIKSNPRKENVLHQKSGEIIQIPRESPLTWVGFENWLFKEGIISQLRTYEQNENDSYAEYLPIITRIKDFIYEDQFSGATVNIFNANIIARKLGLADKKEVNNSGGVTITGVELPSNGED